MFLSAVTRDVWCPVQGEWPELLVGFASVLVPTGSDIPSFSPKDVTQLTRAGSSVQWF